MSIQSRWQIDIPEKDVLSYIFDENLPVQDGPLFEDAENPAETFTKGELKDLAGRMGKGLKDLHDVAANDVVLICAQNSMLYPVVYLGTLCAGGVFCGASPSATISELLTQLDIVSPKVVFADLSTLSTVEKALELYNGPPFTIYLLEDEKQYGSHVQHSHISMLWNRGSMQWEKLSGRETLSNRPALLAFSSGTTGPPKACSISHYNLVAATEQRIFLDKMRLAPEDRSNYPRNQRYCVYLPMYHATGFMWHVHMNCRTGSPTFVLRGYSLPRLIRAIQHHRITNLMIVPPIISSLVKSGLKLSQTLSSLKIITVGGAYLGVESAAALKRILGRENVLIQQGWGMTETTSSVTLFGLDQTDGITVGRLVPNMEAKFIDEDGNPTPPGQIGEAVVRGPNVFIGYWKNKAATEQSKSPDGWLRTGDLVTIDESGLWAIVGRNKDLIKVKGFQVSPSELESVLLSSGHVLDCAVIRVIRDGRECPQAHVVPTNGKVKPADIAQFVEERLSVYKRLTGGVIFVDSIPRLQSGKIIRRLIKDPVTEQSRL